jgi:YD repeat-containing protein
LVFPEVYVDLAQRNRYRVCVVNIHHAAGGVSYAYDAGGRRTRLTLPGGLNVTCGFDARGQMSSLFAVVGRRTGNAGVISV